MALTPKEMGIWWIYSQLLTLDSYVDGNPNHLWIIVTTVITTIVCIIIKFP